MRRMDDMTQTIPHGMWTKLDGYDAEVFHDYGANLNVEVADGELKTNYRPGKLWLRPPGGVWPGPSYQVPIAGTWVMDSGAPIDTSKGTWIEIESGTEDAP